MEIEFISEEHKNITYTKKANSLIKKFVLENSNSTINFKLVDLKDKDSLKLFEFVGLHENATANIHDYESFDQLIKYKELNALNINHNTINDNKKPKIDLSNFPNLTFFSCDWNPKISNIGALEKLKQFNLFQYKPKSKDLTELSTLNSLKYLKLGSGNYESLKGLDNLKEFKRITPLQ